VNSIESNFLSLTLFLVCENNGDLISQVVTERETWAKAGPVASLSPHRGIGKEEYKISHKKEEEAFSDDELEPVCDENK